MSFFFGEPFLCDESVEVLIWLLVLAILSTTEVAASRTKNSIINLECRSNLICVMVCVKKKLIWTIEIAKFDHWAGGGLNIKIAMFNH